MKHVIKILFAALLGIVVAPLINASPALTIPGCVLLTFIPKPEHALGLNNMDMRMVFDNARNALAKAFGYPPESELIAYMKLTQNTIRLEQPIVAGQTLYTFPVFNNQGNPFNTELRMKMQNTDVIYQIGVFLGCPSSATDQTYPLLTYPNTQAFSIAGAAAAANTLYNGIMAMTINNDQVVTAWDLYKHLYRGETQQTAAAGPGSPLDQNRGSWDGFYPMEPNVTLIGQKDNTINILLPVGGITTVQTFSRIIIMMRTIEAQNSTVVS